MINHYDCDAIASAPTRYILICAIIFTANNGSKNYSR